MTIKDGIFYLIHTLKDNRYPYLFITFVLCDVITTYLMYNNNPNFIDLNPNIHHLRTLIPNLAIFYIVFFIIKMLVLEVILMIIDFQNSKIKNSGYITYILILSASIYVFINNLGVLGYV